ncbi:MAG: addiction module protein [Candidatus Aureabacteria bacterium]|nr:addiction module protein [Candidatus Auribacterota bacterium]
MTTETQAIFQQALRLNAVERAELIEALFRSFDPSGDRRVDSLCAREAESRIDAYEAGKMTADSSNAVLKRISDK